MQPVCCEACVEALEAMLASLLRVQAPVQRLTIQTDQHALHLTMQAPRTGQRTRPRLHSRWGRRTGLRSSLARQWRRLERRQIRRQTPATLEAPEEAAAAWRRLAGARRIRLHQMAQPVAAAPLMAQHQGSRQTRRCFRMLRAAVAAEAAQAQLPLVQL